MMREKTFALFILTLLLLGSQSTFAQVLDAIDIELRITEKTKGDLSPMKNTDISITDIGTVTTDSAGTYEFTYTVRENVDPVINIAMMGPEQKLLKPLDGNIILDPTQEKMLIEFVVVNMENESEKFKKQIGQLENRVRSLKQQNKLSIEQINALNATLLDTILFYENNRRALENEIASYEAETEEQKQQIESLQAQLTNMESTVERLTEDLQTALEERYLRQNEYYKNISSNLLAYVRNIKDLRDHMPFISKYYGAAAGYQNYDQDIKKYNKTWEEFDNNRANYIEGVENYWDNTSMVSELEELFDYMVKGIHQTQILSVVRDINTELHSQKPKKAQKVANAAYDNMSSNIRTLEQRINRTVVQLRKNI